MIEFDKMSLEELYALQATHKKINEDLIANGASHIDSDFDNALQSAIERKERPKMTKLEQFILETLDDDYGISERAYNTLRELEEELSPTIPAISDILEQVESIEGRFYLPLDEADEFFHE